jgi:hypothetical protein
MQLHEALTISVEKFGRDIICEKRCINILADYRAFTQYPPCRIILQIIINEQIPEKILSFDSDRDAIVLQLKQFSLNLAKKYGFQTPLINYTLKALTNATSRSGLTYFNLGKFHYDMTAAMTEGNHEQPTSAPTANPSNQPPKPSAPLPVIKTFQRRGEPIIGKECKFVWNVSGANSLHVTGLGALPVTNSGSCKVLISAPYQEIILTASNAGGTVTRTLVVNPGGKDAVPLPTINYFRAAQTGKHVGEKTILEWDVDNAKTIYLEGIATSMVTDTGTQEVLIEATPRTYILKAINAVGKSITDAVVVQTAPPSILSVVASSGTDKVKIGSNVEILWTTEDADSVTISGTGIACPSTRQKANGKLEVTVTEEDPCVILTAYNANASVQDSIRIATEEMERPIVKDFSYKTKKGNTGIFVGDAIKCVWDLENATSVEILEGESVLFSGSPSDTFVYTISQTYSKLALVAKNSRYEELQILEINAERPPVIESFTTSTALCKLGDTIEITWNVKDATQVFLNGQTVAPCDSAKFEINTASFNASIKATTGERSIEKTISVVAMEHPEPIIKFFRYPESADRHKGKTIELEWEVENATEVKLAYNAKKIISVPIKGNKSFKIMRDKCTLTLIATNGDYKTEEQLVIERKKSFWDRFL